MAKQFRNKLQAKVSGMGYAETPVIVGESRQRRNAFQLIYDALRTPNLLESSFPSL